MFFKSTEPPIQLLLLVAILPWQYCCSTSYFSSTFTGIYQNFF